MKQEVTRIIVLSPLIAAGTYLPYRLWRGFQSYLSDERRRLARAARSPDRVMRSVRAEAYDGLPYRHARGSRWQERGHERGRGTWDR
jgi:hypothetical protein